MNGTLISDKTILQNRIQAAYLLSERLSGYRDTDAIVAAVPCGGVPVGFHVAQILGLPLEIIQCKKIRHPADKNKSIGSVSMSNAFLDDGFLDVPQDYIYRKILSHQSEMNEKYRFYSGGNAPAKLTGKTVILVDDLLKSGDTMVACLKGIRKQQPRKLIIAVPVALSEAAERVSPEADEFISLVTDDNASDVSNFYEDFPRVSDEEVKALFIKSRSFRKKHHDKDHHLIG